jgi:release factor glutamine methyltransferase
MHAEPASHAQPANTVRALLEDASLRIPRRDAELLLLDLLGRDRTWLHLHADDALQDALTEDQHADFARRVARRAQQEPVQHITGTQEFFGLPLHVTAATLIPRPETEHLVEAVLEWSRTERVGDVARPLRIVDIGTGSGAIALALARHLPQAQLTALDLSAAALEVARANTTRLGLADRVRLLHSDLLSALEPELAAGTRFDAIVSNPPYIPLSDAPTLAAEVRSYEPHTALFSGADGLGHYRRILPAAHAALRTGGLLALEFGFGQREALRALLLDAAAWHSIRFIDDYAGIPRVALALRA